MFSGRGGTRVREGNKTKVKFENCKLDLGERAWKVTDIPKV